MIKEVIKYVDFNGNENTEEMFFHLSKSEQTKLELAHKGGLSNYIKEVIETGNNTELLVLFEKILIDSYGVKSEDGKRFIKSPSLREEFAQSAAFDALFMEIATTEGKAEAFMQGVVK